MAGRAVPGRAGIAKNYTLDARAVELLLEMAPSTKRVGRYLSQLIYAEHIRQEERAKVRQAVLAAMAGLDND